MEGGDLCSALHSYLGAVVNQKINERCRNMDSLEEARLLEERFDARIISLYSRGVQSGIPQTDNAPFFYAFCYYDAIRVSKVDIGSGPVLKSAYFQALRDSDTPASQLDSQQFLMAVVDVLPEKKMAGRGRHGYTAGEIKAFWDKSKEASLLFVSLINLKDAADLDAVLAIIRTEFPAEKGHLAYLTFDHCDLILFSYGSSFHVYTKQIFRLCFGCDRVLDDVITIYGFNPSLELQEPQERFRALIRIGVRDFPMSLSFKKRVEALEHQVSYSWLLGRNDISLLCEDATLGWLADVRGALIDEEQARPDVASWYTTYDLTVFTSPDSPELANVWYPYGNGINCEKLELRMTDAYKAFEICYNEAFRRLQEEQHLSLTPNMVWLRWLKESCHLVTSLMGSRLSIDLATCLVPQFLDLLQYGRELFTSGRLDQRNQIDDIHRSFSTFFNNVAVLVDSMNQTNRQFVQVPAFHLPSFNLPPQLMAYYTVLSQRLREVLQDDKETIYGLAISPNLSNILSVSSLAVQKSLPKHQWISISIDEPSFYTLKMTTETFAHEISHFIGQDNRERGVRKRCILQCAFQIFFWNILERTFRRVDQYYSHLADPDIKIKPPAFNMEKQEEIAKRLWETAAEIYGEYQEEQRTFSRDLENILRNVPNDICNSPQLMSKVFEEIWRLRDECPKPFQPVIDTLQEALSKINGSPILQESILKKQLESACYDVLKDMCGEFAKTDMTGENGSELCRLIGKLCYMFKETFADLQAILLLDMEWGDYVQLLTQHPQREKNPSMVEDCPLRMLAVARVLLGSGVWTDASLKEGGSALQSVRECVALDYRRAPSKLGSQNINPTFLLYLIEYLTACEEKIKESFANPKRELRIQTLRTLYASLSDRASVCELQNKLLQFIENYRMELLNIPTEDDGEPQEQLCVVAAGRV